MRRVQRLRVALLGCGTVGSEVARQVLAREGEWDLELCAVLVRDGARERGVPRELVVTEFERVLERGPQVVIEAIGGVAPAGELVARSLASGAHVVSANKTLIAHRGEALRALAAEHGVSLRYEAAVGGAVPVLAALEHLRGDRVTSIRAIVNGTCNFVLTRMGSGLTLEQAVAEAQARGLAEPDPSADLSGRDSAEKLCVLAHAAGMGCLRPEQVRTEGIERVTPGDVASARKRGGVLKLLAEVGVESGSVWARVGPAQVPLDHPLARVRGEENGLLISAELAGEVFLRGVGAGPRATASAVLGDLRRVHGQLEQAGVEPPAAVSGPPARAQVVRVARGDADTEEVLAAVREHDPQELELERDAVRAEAVLSEEQALALGLALAGSGERVLVTPLIGGS